MSEPKGKLKFAYDSIANLEGKIQSQAAELSALRERVKEIQDIVNQQAEDDGLWFEATTAPEAYLQQGLRRLHEVIEGKPCEECVEALLSTGRDEG